MGEADYDCDVPENSIMDEFDNIHAEDGMTQYDDDERKHTEFLIVLFDSKESWFVLFPDGSTLGPFQTRKVAETTALSELGTRLVDYEVDARNGLAEGYRYEFSHAPF